MSARSILKLMVGFYIGLFFLFLFGPLIIMGISAFNETSYPQVWPFEGFTFHWFGDFFTDDMMVGGITNSIYIGIGVVCLSVPLGLAGALLMTQVGPRLRPVYYTIVVSPVLTPGVILGISTLVFWDRIGMVTGAGYDTIFYSGFFLTILGQSTYISAYCMLVFLARLQRFDQTQEEAALDLGASNVQVFRKILLPFLKPAILSSAVLAFLSSFENYNTTLFTIQSEATLTTVLAGRVRMGTEPDIAALAVVIISVTLLGAVAYEIAKRREARREKAQIAAAKKAGLQDIGWQPSATETA
ncbi:MAG: ABC transporter permease [Rhodospirillaceae bacterium]|nr:ABC transporter permease [Rhodospirillaceae bacterium]